MKVFHTEMIRNLTCGCYCTFVPPRVRVRATVKLSAAFFHDESSITIRGGGWQGVRNFDKCAIVLTCEGSVKIQTCSYTDNSHLALKTPLPL